MSEFETNSLRNYKTIIIGRSAVGKSTLLLRYVEGEFNPQKPTIGIDYRFKKVCHQGVDFNLQLWDSAGQERYRTIVYNYFTLSKAACIVFDITNEESLVDAKTWVQQLVLHCGNQIPKILLGNKCDMLDPVKLKEQLEKLQPKIDQIAQEYDCHFFSVSAYTGENVEQAFQFLIKQIYERNKISKEDNNKSAGFTLNQPKNSQIIKGPKAKKRQCC